MDLINNTQKVDSKDEKIKKMIKTTIINFAFYYYTLTHNICIF